MVKSHRLAGKILDATCYKLRQLAAYKAEVVTVDPSNTTQRCPSCGLIPEKRIELDVRIYECSNCGLIIDRDHNAALNVLKLGSEVKCAIVCNSETAFINTYIFYISI